MRRSAKLRFERLETRLTPAGSVQFIGGNLRITGDDRANLIAIGESGGNVGVSITTNGQTSNFGTFRVTGSLSVDARNGNDTVNFGVTDTFAGRVSILTGLGDDVVNIYAAGAGASIQGLAQIDTGLGNDAVNLLGNNFRLSMTDVFVTETTGVDSLTLQNADLHGLLVATGADNVTLGTSTVAGQVVINNAIESNAGSLTLSAGSTLGSLTFVGGSASDSVNLAGQVSGNTTLVLCAGDNTVTTNAASLNGALSVIGWGGNDSVNFGTGTDIAGSVNLYLGNGDNVVQANGGVSVHGSFALTALNGNDNVSGGASVPFNADISGNFTVNLGNGNNAFDFAGTLAGNLYYLGGGGQDNVTITGIFGGNLNASLGAGDDTFTWGSSTSKFGRAFIDFGAGTDVYNDGGVIVDFPLTIVGL